MRNRAFSLCVAATFYASATLSAPPPKEPFTEQLSRYPQEKLYVHTDKEHYIAGDTVWLRAHCVDAAGDYTLFMRNLPEDYPLPQAPARGRPARRRKIPARGAPARVLRRILLPRRGLSGQRILLPCGLQGVGRRRTPALLGRGLLDDKGHFIDSLRTRHAGIGSVEFPPRAGRRYMAEFPDRKGRLHRFELPDAKDYTFVLRVDPTDSTFIVSIRSGRNWLPRGLRLVVHRCGTQCYNKAWDPLVPTLTFRREELPEGLFQVLLLDEATGKALSERLGFNRRDEEAEVTMRQEGTLQQRSKVTLHFEVRDTKRRPAQGDFAVAVTDRKAAAPVATAGIYSTLMLSSELRGVIEDPDWYFAPDNAQGDEGLDELLLTQGWRRYDVPKLLRDEYKEPYYPLEAGQEIAGRIERTAMFSKKKKLDRYTMRLLVPERLRHLGSHRRGRVVRTQRVRLPRQHDLRAAPHRPRADDHRRADSHHARFVSRIPHAAAPAAARSDLRGAGAKVYRAARHGRHAEYRYRHRGRDGKTLGRRHRRKRAGTPPGSTVVERRADQGGQRRDDPRLHREDARNAGHGTKGTIPWA